MPPKLELVQEWLCYVRVETNNALFFIPRPILANAMGFHDP